MIKNKCIECQFHKFEGVGDSDLYGEDAHLCTHSQSLTEYEVDFVMGTKKLIREHMRCNDMRLNPHLCDTVGKFFKSRHSDKRLHSVGL